MSIEERVAALEKGSRLWKRMALVSLAALGSVVLMGQAKDKGPADLTVRSLRVVDDEGTLRGALFWEEGVTRLALGGAEGEMPVQVRVTTGGSRIKIQGPECEALLSAEGTRAELCVKRSTPRLSAHTTLTENGLGFEGVTGVRAGLGDLGLDIWDSGGAHIDLGWQEKGANIAVQDQSGYKAVLGTTKLGTKSASETSFTSAASLTFFDSDGNVAWEAQKEPR